MNEWTGRVYANSDERPITTVPLTGETREEALMQLEEMMGEVVQLDTFERTDVEHQNSSEVVYESKVLSFRLIVS